MASAFATIIGLNQTAKFSLVGGDDIMPGFGGPQRTLDRNGAEGATYIDQSGHLRVVVKNPEEGYSRMDPLKVSNWRFEKRTLQAVIGLISGTNWAIWSNACLDSVTTASKRIPMPWTLKIAYGAWTCPQF